MEDVGISLPKDILTYDLLRRLPSSLDNIKQAITHSKNGKDIKPKTLLDHLKIHMNMLKVSAANKIESINATMFTKEDPQCIPGQHNLFFNSHTKERCWMIYPKNREAFLKKKEESQVRASPAGELNRVVIPRLASRSTN
ncbi:hypothetical protein PCASD_04336 [Puccinia coronata f. sp. avenae]|uniref:Uncharacterized protein n=1 Tax=Puccinia coronata f. sp. avenae TaxID=200324 RepID=A0A2N5VCQ3_9BASI|nr:hypothetical protein PCASD_04336 [Puccinia coronata f. sp. avenae]